MPSYLIPSPLKELLRPIWRRVKSASYARLFKTRRRSLSTEFGHRMVSASGISTPSDSSSLARELQRNVSSQFKINTKPLSQLLHSKLGFNSYWEILQADGISREKALEYFLTFHYLDPALVHRHCDVAASSSPFEAIVKRDFAGIEYWKQDLVFQSDFENRIIGGFAHAMSVVPNHFFDSMSLHCSFEHFEGDSDSKFIAEVDRVLSSVGACIILPLYLSDEPKIHFDPTRVTPQQLRKYDATAKLVSTFEYRQDHGRFYSPQTLLSRIMTQLPLNLKATVIHFEMNDQDPQDIYLRFGLVLHRPDSIFRTSL